MAGAYQPEEGDFAYLDFTPHSGTQQAGRRPALVLSPRTFNIATGLMFACPVTRQAKGSSFEVPIPRGASVTGVVLSDQLRSLDWIARHTEYRGIAPDTVVDEVIARIEAVLTSL